MSWTFYNQHGHVVEAGNTEDKKLWCAAGETLEQSFVNRYGAELSLGINPAKATDKTAPDLIWTGKAKQLLADLKTQNTPFFTALAAYKMDPRYTVTFNRSDIDYYGRKYPDLLLYFWVNWYAVRAVKDDLEIKLDPLEGVWGVSFRRLFQLAFGAPVVHYQRRENDTDGNARSSSLLSLNDMKRLV